MADSPEYVNFGTSLKKLKQELLQSLAQFWAKDKVLGPMVCQCLSWKFRSLELILQKLAPRSLDLLISMTGAGSVCRQCINHDLGPKREWFLERVWDGFHRSETIPQDLFPQADKKIFSNKAEALEFFDAWVARDAGELEIVDTIGDDLVIKLGGACQSCPSRERSCQHMMEKWWNQNLTTNQIPSKVWVEKV